MTVGLSFFKVRISKSLQYGFVLSIFAVELIGQISWNVIPIRASQLSHSPDSSSSVYVNCLSQSCQSLSNDLAKSIHYSDSIYCYLGMPTVPLFIDIESNKVYPIEDARIFQVPPGYTNILAPFQKEFSDWSILSVTKFEDHVHLISTLDNNRISTSILPANDSTLEISIVILPTIILDDQIDQQLSWILTYSLEPKPHQSEKSKASSPSQVMLSKQKDEEKVDSESTITRSKKETREVLDKAGETESNNLMHLSIQRKTNQPVLKNHNNPDLTGFEVFRPSLTRLKRIEVYNQLDQYGVLSKTQGEYFPVKTSKKMPKGHTLFQLEVYLNLAQANLMATLPSPSANFSIGIPLEKETPLEFLQSNTGELVVRTNKAFIDTLTLDIFADTRYFSTFDPKSIEKSFFKFEPSKIPTSMRNEMLSFLPSNFSQQPHVFQINYLSDWLTSFSNIFNFDSDPPLQWLAANKLGACRHRSLIFFIVANSVGIPTRYVANDVHAFVEIWDGITWRQLDLGGAESNVDRNSLAGNTEYKFPLSKKHDRNLNTTTESRLESSSVFTSNGGIPGTESWLSDLPKEESDEPFFDFSTLKSRINTLRTSRNSRSIQELDSLILGTLQSKVESFYAGKNSSLGNVIHPILRNTIAIMIVLGLFFSSIFSPLNRQ